MAVLAGRRGSRRRLPRSSASRSPAATCSFYNQTGDVPIHPTPVVAVLGTIDDVARRVPSGWQDAGDNLYLLGTTSLELDGSAWAGRRARPPRRAPAGRRPRRARRRSPGCSPPPRTRGCSTPRTTSPTAASRPRSPRACCASASARGSCSTTCSSATASTRRPRCSASRPAACSSPCPREEDVKFTRLCEGRGYPVLRIGVTDAGADGRAASRCRTSSRPPSTSSRTTYREPLRPRTSARSSASASQLGLADLDGSAPRASCDFTRGSGCRSSPRRPPRGARRRRGRRDERDRRRGHGRPGEQARRAEELPLSASGSVDRPHRRPGAVVLALPDPAGQRLAEAQPPTLSRSVMPGRFGA